MARHKSDRPTAPKTKAAIKKATAKALAESPGAWDVTNDPDPLAGVQPGPITKSSGGGTMLDKQLIGTAIRAAMGNLSQAAENLRITRRTLFKYIERDPGLREIYEDAKEVRIDFVEDGLIQAVRRGREIPMIFFLKTQARHRGYVERQEITGHDGAPIQFNVKWEVQNLTTGRNDTIITDGESGADIIDVTPESDNGKD